MARKPALSIEALTALGAAKLARLVLDEAERSAPFRRLVSAALAGQKGPDAIAGIVDRRLSALEKARGFIDWVRARAFRDDLATTVAVICDELGEASPVMALDRLLRFIATHESVFERIDDSSGRIQNVYDQAITAAGALTPRLAQADATQLPARIMAALGNTSHGYLVVSRRLWRTTCRGTRFALGMPISMRTSVRRTRRRIATIIRMSRKFARSGRSSPRSSATSTG